METKFHGTQLLTAVPTSQHASASLSLNAGLGCLSESPSLTDSTLHFEKHCLLQDASEPSFNFEIQFLSVIDSQTHVCISKLWPPA